MNKLAYWQYLNDSLELDNFILPQKDSSGILYNPNGVLGFYVDTESSSEEIQLFEKMVTAMGFEFK